MSIISQEFLQVSILLQILGSSPPQENNTSK